MTLVRRGIGVRIVVAILGLVVALAVTSRRGAAQSITGVLRSATDSQPIPYATVIIGDSAEGRFADADGHFAFGRVLGGTYRLRARQIGFAPLDTTIAVGAEPVSLVLRLVPAPIKIETIAVRAQRSKVCEVTGIPDSSINAPLASLFRQLRDNVDRYRILLDQYPFHYRREEYRFVRLGDRGDDSTVSLDTVSYYSRDRRPYRVGGVVYNEVSVRGELQPTMYLPTFRDLVDTAFQAAHCFTLAGGEHGLIRIDFKPATEITVPDVEGSVYLDARRLIVRRAIFELTKPSMLKPPIVALTVTTTFDEVAPLIPVFGTTRTEQPMIPLVRRVGANAGEPMNRIMTRTFIEEDRLLDHSFADGLLASRPLPSPEAPPPGSPPPGPPGLCHLPTPTDTINVLIYGTLAGGPPGDPRVDKMLRGLLRTFKPAPGVSLPVFGFANEDGSIVAPTLTGEVSFTLGKGAQLTDVHIVTSSLSPTVDSALVTAVSAASLAGDFGHTLTGRFSLSLSSTIPAPTARAVALARLEVPGWRFARHAALAPDSVIPKFPPGHGTFEVVVDETGRAVPASLRSVDDVSDHLSAVVAGSISDFRFDAARIGACTVKQVMQITVPLTK